MLMKYKGVPFTIDRTSPHSAEVRIRCEMHDHDELIIGLMEHETAGWVVGRKTAGHRHEGRFRSAVEHAADLLVEECLATDQMDKFFTGVGMRGAGGDEHLLEEQLDEFFGALFAALSRVLRDLAVAPPETHHREWILYHLRAFMHDEAGKHELRPEVLNTLEWFHRTLTEFAEPEEPPL